MLHRTGVALTLGVDIDVGVVSDSDDAELAPLEDERIENEVVTFEVSGRFREDCHDDRLHFALGNRDFPLVSWSDEITSHRLRR